MLTFANKYGHNITSQNGENGIILEALRRIKPVLKAAIEFGAPNQIYCSNIYPLNEKGWMCHYFDDQTMDPFVTRMRITTDNINTLPPCTVLSIDCDGPDYELWRAYKGLPDIVIIEINSSLPPMAEYYSSDKGASYITMARLARQKGYFVLCHTGNIIAVRDEYREVFLEIVGDGIENYIDYFNNSWL